MYKKLIVLFGFLMIVASITYFYNIFNDAQKDNVYFQPGKIHFSEQNKEREVDALSDKKSLLNKKSDIPSESKHDMLEPEIHQALTEMLNTSSEGLVEKKTGSSVSVDLQGRFQTVPVATINEKGELEIRDYSSKPKKDNQ